jgi:hypothetical protein
MNEPSRMTPNAHPGDVGLSHSEKSESTRSCSGVFDWHQAVTTDEKTKTTIAAEAETSFMG